MTASLLRRGAYSATGAHGGQRAEVSAWNLHSKLATEDAGKFRGGLDNNTF
jgi:hypothetical protein